MSREIILSSDRNCEEIVLFDLIIGGRRVLSDLTYDVDKHG